MRFLSCLFVLLLFASCGTNDAQAAKPNIVLIAADDLGYGELGCYGSRLIHTPRIDALARQGMRFTDFYSGHNVCAPSRCTLMTGKHCGHAFVRDNKNPKGLQALKKQYGWKFPGQMPIPESEITLPEQLSASGYRTGGMGKWGLGHAGTTGDPTRQGFDLFYGFLCQVHAHNHYPRFLWRNQTQEVLPGNDRELYGGTHSQDRFVDVAKEFVKSSVNDKKPFFLYLPFAIPHLSIQVPHRCIVAALESKDSGGRLQASRILAASHPAQRLRCNGHLHGRGHRGDC
ncbi:MAG: sulfatase-like hydrolase/transferase [Planctomycetota bacterium]